jgi:hypothetical protein
MSTADVMIHVRFTPDGTVAEIGERPGTTSAQSWFDYLTERVGESFQPLSGGRGLFRVERATVDAFKAALTAA